MIYVNGKKVVKVLLNGSEVASAHRGGDETIDYLHYVDVDKGQLTFDAAGGKAKLKVTSNTSWSFAIDIDRPLTPARP